MANPANVDAKLKIAAEVAGVGGARLEKCFPPTPSVMTSLVMKKGIRASPSYLLREAWN